MTFDTAVLIVALMLFAVDIGFCIHNWHCRKTGKIQGRKYDAPVNDTYHRKVMKTVSLSLLLICSLLLAVIFMAEGRVGMSAFFTFAFVTFIESLYEYSRKAWRVT